MSVRDILLRPGRWRMAAALPLRLRGRRVSVSPTRYGFLFFAMLAALLFGSTNHNNNLGFILTFLLGGMALVSVLHTLRNVSGISVDASRADPVFAGQNAVFELVVSPVRRDKLGISFAFTGGEQTTVSLRAGNGQSVSVHCRAEKRGLLDPGGVSISTVFPLGLFRAWTVLDVPASCLVYPKPLPGPMVTVRIPQEEDADAGDAGGPGVDDFVGLEVYRQGDPLQHVSWKAYSRGQGLYTKRFEGVQGGTLFFNPDALEERSLEDRLSRVCFMVLSAEAKCLSYGLQLGDRVIAPASGGSHKGQCLRELALAGRAET